MGSSPTGFSIAMRICECCGKELISRYQRRYCSRSCGNRGKTRHGTPGRFQPKPCGFCGKEHSNPKYCSISCGMKAVQHKRFPPGTRLQRLRLKNLLCTQRYYAKRFGQTPVDADREKIKAFYAACPDGHEVDHVIPISRGGLHHQDNLQYLPMLDNRRKSNKLDWTSTQAANGK